MTKPSEELFGTEHVQRYQATDGEEGYIWKRGTTILLLTTVGRKSGETRTTPLIFREIDGNYVIVASKGGAPEHPGWYLNLKDEPVVDVQIKGDRFKAKARDADAGEHARMWPMMAEVWPDYEAYQASTDRQIPIVVLERH